ncbi:MAG: hypothetical protein QXK47_02460 [Candidatus Bathyarchaeia archaeon]
MPRRVGKGRFESGNSSVSRRLIDVRTEGSGKMKFEEAWFYFTSIGRVFRYKNGGKGGIKYPRKRKNG